MNVNVIKLKNRFEMRYAHISELMNKLFSHANHIKADIYAVMMMMIIIIIKVLTVAIVLRFNAFL